MHPLDVSPEDVKRRLDAGDEFVILDVRQPEETAVGRLAGSMLIPLGELPSRLAELDPDADIVVHCKMGGRASQAVAFLRQQGFSRVSNMAGGLTAWAQRIDPSVRVA